MPLGFVLVVIAILFIYLALVRPQRRKQDAQVHMWQELAPGDEVVTAGGIYGEIVGFRGDDVLVEIAPDLEVRVARRAIAGVFKEEPEPDEPEPPEPEPG
jgi:preprotein translocase subunit YajC